MSKFQLPESAERLGLRYRDTSAIHIDWTELRGKLEGEDPVVHPDPTPDVLDEYGFANGRNLEDENELKEAIEQFQDSDSFHEWRDRNQPMMNVLWPVTPCYGTDLETAAALMAEHGGATCLVKFDLDDEEVVGIALTGGGMNLSHDIAAAYICCGHCPPTAVIEDALSQIREMSAPCRQLAVDAATKLAQSLRFTAENLEQRAVRASNEIAPEDGASSAPSA